VSSGDHRSDRLLEFLLASRRPERYSAKRDVRVSVEVLERKLLVLPVDAVEVLAVEARVVEVLGVAVTGGGEPAGASAIGQAAGQAIGQAAGGASIGPRARADPRPRARSPEVLNSSTHSLREIPGTIHVGPDSDGRLLAAALADTAGEIDAADIHLPDLPPLVDQLELLLPEIPVALEDSFNRMKRAPGSEATAPEGPYPAV